MADTKKDLEIHLKASGGKDAAAEVETVEEAIVDLGTASTDAGESTTEDLAPALEDVVDAAVDATEAINDLGKTTAEELVPAWEDAAEAAVEVERAVEKVEDATGALDKVQTEVSENAAALRDQLAKMKEDLEDLGAASDGAGEEIEILSTKKVAAILKSKDLSTATGGLTARLARMLTPLGLVTAALGGAIAGWRSYAAAQRQAREEAQSLADSVAQTARRIQDSFDNVKLSPDGRPSWVDELRQAQTDLEGFDERIAHYTEMLDAQAQAEDRLREAILRKRLASGDIEQDQFDREMADNRIEALRRQAAAEVARVGEEAVSLRRELTLARELEAEARADLRRAEADITEREAAMQERRAVVERMAERARQLAAANQAIREGQGPEFVSPQLSGPDMETFSRAAAVAAGNFVDVDNKFHEYSEMLEAWISAGRPIEDFLRQHPAVYRRMTDSLSAEAEGAAARAETTAETLKKERDISDLLARREAALAETVRMDEEVAAIRRREEENDRAVQSARFRRDTLVEGYEVPIINEGVEAADAARERAAREKEEARAQTEALKAERDALIAEREQIQALIKDMALEFGSEADTAGNRGLNEAARVLNQASRAMADGLTMGEGERIIHETARVLEQTPEHMQRIVEAAFAPLRQATSEHLRRIEQVESRINALR